MQIKRFEARTMTEALKLVKNELGTEAVILSACSRRGTGVFSCFRKAGVEVTAAGAGALPPLLPGGCAEDGRTGDLEGRPILAASRRSPRPNRFPGLDYPPRIDPGKPPEAGRADQVMARIGGHWLYRRLLSHGVEERYARRLTSDFLKHEKGPGDDPALRRSRLAGVIAQMGASVKPLAIERGQRRRIALVGPSGVGKTTAAAKLAAAYTLAPGMKVALLSLDTYRVAAAEELKAYAAIIDIPTAVVSDRSGLVEALEKYSRYDLVLIDTPGVTLRNTALIRTLGEVFEGIAALEVQLVLSATARLRDGVDLCAKLSGFRIERLMFSKIDETCACGSLLNFLLRLRLPAACLFDGAPGVDGVKDADLETLAALVADDNRGQAQAAAVPPADGAPQEGALFAPDAEACAYVANRNSSVFHTADCKWATAIKDENMIGFASVAEARNHQYKPCRTCCREALVGLRTESMPAGRSLSVGYR
ncbi:MAG: hypothetical protein WAM73_04275 [Desulfobacterales bacterium]